MYKTHGFSPVGSPCFLLLCCVVCVCVFFLFSMSDNKVLSLEEPSDAHRVSPRRLIPNIFHEPLRMYVSDILASIGSGGIIRRLG